VVDTIQKRKQLRHIQYMMDIYIPNTSFMPTVINKETQLQCQNTGKHYDMCNGMYVNQTGGEWNTVNVNEYRKNRSEQFSTSEQQKKSF
jgi:hypothetical protein